MSSAAARPAAPRGDTTLPSLLVLGTAVSLVYLGAMLFAAEGHFVAQVADLYLVARYAQAMAEGRPFEYNPGDAPTTGATSLLHTLLLAVGHTLGARGEGLVAFAVVLGAGLYLASIAFATRIARRLGSEREAKLAGAMVALGGPTVWGFHYGSDISVFMLLTLALLDGVLRAWPARRYDAALLPAALLAVARPEGLPLAILLAAAFWRHLGRDAPWRERLAALAPVAAGLLVLLLYRVRTGSWMGTSFSDKSLFDNYGLVEGSVLVTDYAVDVIRGLLLGLYPSTVPIGLARGFASHFFAPLALLAVALVVLRPPDELKAPLRAFLGSAALVAALVVPNVFLGVHFHRYLMWTFPVLQVLAACGLARACLLVARDDARLERGLFKAGAALVLVLGLLSTVRFAAVYAQMAAEMWRRDLAAAQWIVKNVPAGTPVANVATSLEYLTGHRALNLHGVTNAEFFGTRTAEREAGMLESLARLPAGARPPWLVSTVATQQRSSVLQAIAETEPVFQTLSLSDDIVIHATRWRALDAARDPRLPATLAAVEGLRLVDALNVADGRDEAAHAYQARSRLGSTRLDATARVASYADGVEVADAGRAMFGSEAFTVAAVPGRDLVIVLRTSDTAEAGVMRAEGPIRVSLGFASAAAVVEVDGQVAVRGSFAPRTGWDEVVWTVPGVAVRADRVRLRVSGRYAAFRYWFYQR
jgi:hypothetical protein